MNAVFPRGQIVGRLDLRPTFISGSASSTHISVSSHRAVTLAEPCNPSSASCFIPTWPSITNRHPASPLSIERVLSQYCQSSFAFYHRQVPYVWLYLLYSNIPKVTSPERKISIRTSPERELEARYTILNVWFPEETGTSNSQTSQKKTQIQAIDEARKSAYISKFMRYQRPFYIPRRFGGKSLVRNPHLFDCSLCKNQAGLPFGFYSREP